MKHVFARIAQSVLLSVGLVAQVPGQPVAAKGHDESNAVSIKARVDQRVELLSIIARLAGYEEYSSRIFEQYVEDVEKHFERYKQHPAVQYATKIRESHNIGFDAVMAFAVHINAPPALTPNVPFTEEVPDKRWGKGTAEEFLKLLRQFYKDADCEAFFSAHADLYGTAAQRFQQVLNKVDFDWYYRFYGERPKGSFNLCLSLLNGGGNYGPKVAYRDGREDLYAIIGTWQVDASGLPVYGEDQVLPTIIHEFNHSFINQLVLENEAALLAAGEKIYAPVAEKMKRLAYGRWQTALLESLVRAAVIRYRFDHRGEYDVIDKALVVTRNLGFLWIDELFALLGAYENSRSVYPSLRSFFPLIAGYYDDLAKRIDYKAKRFEEMSPRVIAVEPFANGGRNVSLAVSLVTFTFSEPLDPKAGHSIDYGDGGAEHYPIEKVIGYNESGNAFTVQVKLKPDWEYEFVVTGGSFRSKAGWYPLQTYHVKFRTAKTGS